MTQVGAFCLIGFILVSSIFFGVVTPFFLGKYYTALRGKIQCPSHKNSHKGTKAQRYTKRFIIKKKHAVRISNYKLK